MKIAKQVILLSSGVAGGFLAGYLTSSYHKSGQFQERKKRVEITISRFNKLLKESQVRLREANSRIKKELSQPIPDLYRATESLSFDENELIYD